MIGVAQEEPSWKLKDALVSSGNFGEYLVGSGIPSGSLSSTDQTATEAGSIGGFVNLSRIRNERITTADDNYCDIPFVTAPREMTKT